MLKRVGAISDNSIERTRGNRRRDYGFSILFLPQRNDGLNDCWREKHVIRRTGDRRRAQNPPPQKRGFLNDYIGLTATAGGSLERKPLPQQGQTLKLLPRIFCRRSVVVAAVFG